MASLKATNNPIGFNIYLFKKRENIKITRATAKTVLIMNAFLFQLHSEYHSLLL